VKYRTPFTNVTASCHCGPPGLSRRQFDELGLALAALALPGGARAAIPEAHFAVKARLKSFPLQQVRLLEGPFLRAQQLAAKYILSLEPDRMLHNFRINAGLKPKAPVYGGWESEKLWADIHCQGHTAGHYMSGCAMMFAATGDASFAERLRYMVGELAACQAASNSGLLCAFPEGPSLVTNFIATQRVSGVPWYTLHKIFLGLLDAHQIAGIGEARDVLLRFADWAVLATRPLSDAQFEAMLAIEHGGMNELFADLYLLTGNAEYRTLAQRFSHKALLQPLSRSRDYLDGLHANTQVPKAVGFQRVYEATGEKDYHAAAAFFWRTVVETRSYATGGHGDLEHFYPMADSESHVFSPKTSETCGMYNMLKLTRLLFMGEPSAQYADYYERALYNGILASQDPGSGMVTYFQGGRPGYMKLYNTPVDSFWCCTGTGMENHAKYGDSIYFHEDGALYVNLFIPSVVTWDEEAAIVTQRTGFPDIAATSLHLNLKRPGSFSLKLRHPGWSRTAEVRVNGAVVARSERPASYISVQRRWNDGDIVELKLDMRVATAPLAGAPDIFAFTYGPLVLAGALGNEGIAPGSDIVVNEREVGRYLDTPFEAPRLAGTPESLLASVRPGESVSTFTVPDARRRPILLKPYHRIAHERYAVYWQLS
jgi:DUF1680 family protein